MASKLINPDQRKSLEKDTASNCILFAVAVSLYGSIAGRPETSEQ
jgi:hypothetical protein